MSKNAHDLVERADEQARIVRDEARSALETFIADAGELYPMADAVAMIDAGDQLTRDILAHLATDGADPVQAVRVDGVTHIGVIDFVKLSGSYGYQQYDDVRGLAKKVVCSQCVQQGRHADEVGKVVAHDVDLDEYEQLAEFLVSNHYTRHDVDPEAVEIEIGASLASGTTINANTAIHGGNQGSFNVDSFSGSAGTTDQFLQTDGSSLSFGDAVLGDYEVQKNGSDASGIINFKT